MTMKKQSLIALGCLSVSGMAFADMEDDPLLYKVMINQLELRDASGSNPRVWDIQGWLGKDLDKLWIKTEGEYVNGNAEEAELQLLYSRAIAPFWDLQAGWRRDIRPKPNRDWLALGIQGVAPYFFEMDAALFVGESGRTALRLDAEYELLFTQRLILTPEIEMNFYGKDDPEVNTGSGLSDLSVGLRLRYEIRREFAPYVGIHWSKKHGDTADYARAEGERVEDAQFVLGVRAWF